MIRIQLQPKKCQIKRMNIVYFPLWLILRWKCAEGEGLAALFVIIALSLQFCWPPHFPLAWGFSVHARACLTLPIVLICIDAMWFSSFPIIPIASGCSNWRCARAFFTSFLFWIDKNLTFGFAVCVSFVVKWENMKNDKCVNFFRSLWISSLYVLVALVCAFVCAWHLADARLPSLCATDEYVIKKTQKWFVIGHIV